MHKRWLLLLIALGGACLPARADDVADVRKAFDSFVQYSKTADPRLMDLFAPDVMVVQVIDSHQGKENTVIPTDTFLQIVKESIEAKAGSTDTYTDVKCVQEDDKVRLTCTQTASGDKPEPLVLLYTKDAQGRFRIKAMKTTVDRPQG